MKASYPTIKKPAEKILLISDNLELTIFLQKIIEATLFKHPIQIDYRHSSLDKDMLDIGSQLINVKNPETTLYLIKNYDLILSIHCKQIFPPALVENVCCINFHPGLNPYNRGYFPHVFSIINGLPTGVTIHMMDKNIDHGNIIAQKKVSVNTEDTSFDVYRKLVDVEKELINENLFYIIEGLFKALPPSHEGNYNRKKDYQNLCKLELTDVGTLQEHINLLRATTHRDFKNAYFLDAVGNKYYVRISIEKE